MRISYAYASLIIAVIAIVAGLYVATVALPQTGTVLTSDAVLGSAAKKPKPKPKVKRGPRGWRGSIGPQGPKGDPGPAGPPTGPAGGSLAGSYPNPALAAGAVGPAALAPVPAARIKLPARGAVQARSDAIVSWTSEDYDHGDQMFRASGGPCAGKPSTVLCAPIGGIYDVNVNVTWNAEATGVSGSRVTALNAQMASGTREVAVTEGPPSPPGLYTQQALATQIALAPGETVTVRVVNNADEAVDLISAEVNHFAMRWVAPPPS